MSRVPRPVAAFPPLPELIPWPVERVPAADDGDRLMRAGCYLIRYTPPESPGLLFLHYDGTLRVEIDGVNITASGDLYLHDNRAPQFPAGSAEPQPGSGVPAFPAADYRYYLRVSHILPVAAPIGSIMFGFDLHRFDATTGSWTAAPTLTAAMSRTTAPAEFPSAADYLTGDVRTAGGAVVAKLTMGWVSSYLRRAVVEIDSVAGAPAPLDNGIDTGWRTVFDEVGWDVAVIGSDADIQPPSGASWSNEEMHAAMLEHREATAGPATGTWVYYVLAVGLLDETERGIMFDAGATDSNNVPREGAGIAADWTVPDIDFWGLVRGLRFGDAPEPYFRTALHEIGHAMGLYHNTADMGFMNTTDVIAAGAEPAIPFPRNIQWSYAPDDRKRLRHLPDVWVRPGGTPFGAKYSTAPISADDLRREAIGLRLDVSPVRETVPLGAPVRIEYTLVNTADTALPAPGNLRLRSGFVRGLVVDPSGTVRSFSPIIGCLDEQPVADLLPQQRLEHSAALLRGPQGALFPMAGPYRVVVEVDWTVDGVPVGVSGETVVMVTPVENDAHATAALRILTTPDAVVTLAIGGEHLPEGVAAIQAGLQDPTLHAHYAGVEARRVGTGDAAAELLDRTTVLSTAEIDRMGEMVRKTPQTVDTADVSVTNLLGEIAAEIGGDDKQA